MSDYVLLGTNDDTDTCEVCGREELRSVLMLGVRDADGGIEGIVYAGSTCGAKMLKARGVKVSARTLLDAGTAADRVRAEALDWAAEYADMDLDTYRLHNAIAERNFGRALVQQRYAETVTEVAQIRSGTLIGTRFEARLPTLGR